MAGDRSRDATTQSMAGEPMLPGADLGRPRPGALQGEAHGSGTQSAGRAAPLAELRHRLAVP